jgi:large-conductance mechanosensitive channel
MNSKGLGWGILVTAFIVIIVLIIGAYVALMNMTNSAMGGDLTSTFSYGIFILFGVITFVIVALIILLRPSKKYPRYSHRLGFLHMLLREVF